MFVGIAYAHDVKGQNILDQRITIKISSEALKSAFATIEQNANVRFIYNPREIQSSHPVTVDAQNMTLRDVLGTMLNPMGVSFEVSGRQIALFRQTDLSAINNMAVTINPIDPFDITIRGKVTDLDTGDGLPGVTVRVKGTANGTITNGNGDYSVSVPNANAVLSYTFVGYLSQEIAVGSRTVINVSLKPDVKVLNEVVVIGYGTEEKNKLTTSIASISNDAIKNLSVTRIEQALQGNAPGVMVLNQNGQPGDKPMIRIRGTGTNNSPDPLFVVDGFPVGSIEYLNSGDIERIDILKDAASAAIYGARGANGVVLITTKKGKRGTASIVYDGYSGTQTAWRTVPVMNATQYATMMNQSYTNLNPTGTALPYTNPSSLGAGTDWQGALFDKNVPVANHQITASGGNDKAAYLASFSYFDQQGVIGGKNSEFNRYTLRLNLDQNVTNYLKVGTNISYVYSERRAIFDNGDQGGSVLGHAFNIDPITPLYETDVTKLASYNVNAVKNGTQVYGISPLSIFPNPLAQLAIINGNNKVDKFFGNLYGDLNLGHGLFFKSSFGIDLSNNTNNSLVPIYFLMSGSGQTSTTVNKSFSRALTWQTENVLSFVRGFGAHNVEALVGQSAFKYFAEDLSGKRTDPSVIDPNVGYLNVATLISASDGNAGGADARTLASYFGRLAYNYKGKYFLSGVIRRDGSSRFGRNNPYATFPSASAAWVLSQESFFPKNGLISLLKLRGSWGQNGNENLGSSFPWASTVGFNGQNYTFLVNGVETYVSGAALGRIANPFLKWETSEQTDLGLDLELLKSKLALNADYYIKTTKDLLIAPDVPAIVGFPAPFVNGGSVENRGVELGINYKNKLSKDFGLNVSFNIAHNTNKVTAINNNAKVIAGAAYINMGSITRMTVGEPIGYFWGQRTAGIFQSQAEVDAYNFTNPTTGVVNLIQPSAKAGDLKFIDTNNDGKISDLDRVNIGDPNPKYVTGLTINMDFKNFDVSVFTVGMLGQKVFNGNYRFDKAASNLPVKWLDSWTPTNTTAKYPRFVAGSANFSTVSDFYLEDGSFVRVKNIQLGYTLPQAITTKARINSLRVYVAVDNAFTFTKYTGFDPELGATGPLSLGIDRGVYPQAVTTRFGVNLKL
jgi:TonB-linked SusC/RagA family outer membrane protein